MAQLVKNLPAMQETCVQSLNTEDHLEKEMATHSSSLAWRIPWTEKLGRLQSMGLQSGTRLSVLSLSKEKVFSFQKSFFTLSLEREDIDLVGKK